VVGDGRLLVEACRRVLPDLVISDVEMPVMGGLEAVALVCRERPVPVILLTACDPADPRWLALEKLGGAACSCCGSR
jgi:CheY-like chemotaxis protein